MNNVGQNKERGVTMKLNFLNVLNKKSTPDEIAEQIVALEIKKGQCEKIRDEAKHTCKELRGKMMCGEKVNPEAVKQADKAYEETILDLEIVAESIEELNKKLYAALEAHREEESRQIINDRRRWEGEREKLMREISKIKGRLVGLMTGIYHYPEEATRQLESYPSFTFPDTHPYFAEFTAEKDRALAELRRPAPADLDNAIQQKDRWLFTFNLEDEYQGILKKHRSKIQAGAD